MRPVLALAIVLAGCGTLTPSESDGRAPSEMPADGGVLGADGSAASDGSAADGGGGLTLPDGATCAVGGAPCGSDSYCDSRSCGQGVCVKKGAAPVNLQYAPVCGCDGVTYWNVYFSMFAGVSYTVTSACPKADPRTKTCDVGSPCPAGTKCSVITISTQCGVTAGVCAQVPSTCGTGANYHPCGNANDCMPLCTAIATEAAFVYDTAKCP